MSAVSFVIVLLATAAVVGGGIVVTFKAFRAANAPSIEPKPRGAKGNPHDAAMTAQLKHFFEGKQCTACSRPIQPVHAGDLRPGLVNADTHEPIAWNDIPATDLSATLASHLPICSNCVILEGLRRQNPELVVDRHRPVEKPLV